MGTLIVPSVLFLTLVKIYFDDGTANWYVMGVPWNQFARSVPRMVVVRLLYRIGEEALADWVSAFPLES